MQRTDTKIQRLWNVKNGSHTSNNWSHCKDGKIIHTVPKQHIGKAHQETTEHSHIGHCTHTAESTGKVKGKVIPLQARCGTEGGRGAALLFHDRGTRRGWVVSSTPRPHFTPGKDPVPIVQEAGWAPGDGRAENLVPTGIGSRTVQPVVSRHSDWTSRPAYCGNY
jgi:hypothetical protein